ncbi:MAG: hypothetical protein ACREPI_01410 [Candidatus Dormibacterales bacterium]
MQAIVPQEERRRALRRLDDILEALEQLNLRDEVRLPALLRDRLVELGIDNPAQIPVPVLIEKVWERQQPYLIVLTEDRRRRRRRQSSIDPIRWGFPSRR